jgi:hypothetical protein
MINPTPSTTNGTTDHGVISSWKKAQVKDAHFHPYLPHLWSHAYSNSLMAYSVNVQPLALLMEILAMTARGGSLTYSALSMTYHHAFTYPTSTFYVNKSAPAAPPSDAS